MAREYRQIHTGSWVGESKCGECKGTGKIGTYVCGYCEGVGRFEDRYFTRVDITGVPTLADKIARIICNHLNPMGSGRLALSKSDVELADSIVEFLKKEAELLAETINGRS